ncbi:hypothetical protein ACTND0_09660, partial [Lactobacillus amylovorus]|uniref:hypothetical protein n=1 Tax=Lactobacillus amylovorus TaxID=1604 RepID=UPI003F88CCEB
SILTSIDVFVVINILSNRSKWTFYFLSSVQFNFTIGELNNFNIAIYVKSLKQVAMNLCSVLALWPGILS